MSNHTCKVTDDAMSRIFYASCELHLRGIDGEDADALSAVIQTHQDKLASLGDDGSKQMYSRMVVKANEATAQQQEDFCYSLCPTTDEIEKRRKAAKKQRRLEEKRRKAKHREKQGAERRAAEQEAKAQQFVEYYTLLESDVEQGKRTPEGDAAYTRLFGTAPEDSGDDVAYAKEWDNIMHLAKAKLDVRAAGENTGAKEL
eukprot:SAG31_NODE_2935_length_4895_cov_5.362177_6_plen_201_part_00